MGTWPDETRSPFQKIAGGLLAVGEAVDAMIKAAGEDEDITVLVDTLQWLRDRASLFSPPGEPQEGYQSEGATVISLDAFREWRKVQKHG